MKQYTSKDQTAKLIELGFPKPQGWGNKDISNGMSIALYNDGREDFNYSIGELIKFLEHRIYRIENDMQWLVDGVRVYRADEELINALFEACVTLKEEGVI
jgi:benzoyl-CoA reductase/2-hydroxyglutaryl-CoA dehydratase subunit BcrC/BadD/HgdB